MMFETLENRQMFSGSAAIIGKSISPIAVAVLSKQNLDPNLSIKNSTRLVNGTLYVIGTDSDDTITVTQTPGIVSTQLRSRVIGIGPITPIFGPQIKVTRNVSVDTFSLSSVKKIVISGYKGSDTLKVDPAIMTPATIYGGDGDDTIQGGGGADYLEGDAGDDQIFGNGGNDTIFTVSGNDRVFGGAGDDTITGGAGNEYLDGGAGNDTIYGQAGNDQIFGGDGNDNLYGGPGDDTIVSVFGGKDTDHGDAGWDIFVADKTDVLYDADTLATTRGSVYRIDKFTNPTVGGSHPVYATDLGATSITEPSLTSAATHYADFAGTPLFTSNGPLMSDIKQGQVDDCWFEATAAGVAQSTPWVIKRSIVDLGDGTYMVALGSNVYRVDTKLPEDANGKLAYAKVARPNGQTLWFALMEKALTYYVGSATNAHYGDIVASMPGKAYDALRVSYDSHTLVSVLGFGTDENEMFDYINTNRGKSMVVDTEPGWAGVASELVPSHAYTVVDCYSIGTKKMVLLRNPWGYNGSDSSTDGLINVSADDLWNSCDELYVAN